MDLAAPGASREFSMAVNLSARSLLDASLPDVVQGALSRWRVAPHLLDLEITETIIMTDPARARRVLTELADIGVTLSIDDFGTGYSSLAYLRDLPVHQLKIDRSFVSELGKENDCVAIIRAVTRLGSSLGMTTTAEGVETEQQLEILRAEGCVQVQGYLFSRPKPLKEIPTMLRELQPRIRAA